MEDYENDYEDYNEYQEDYESYDGYDDSPYAGTYAHDVAGWTDEMIDDALDDEPDAYWNID